jgi:dUTP pyrophosphatase
VVTPDEVEASGVDGTGAVPVLLHRLDPEVPVPGYAHPGDAAVDLVTVDPVDLAPGERVTVGTGVAVALPAGYGAFVLPRSGLAARFGLTVVNGPGTIDAGYRGEVRVTLLNTDRRERVRLDRGDRVAQLAVLPLPAIRFVEVDQLPGSVRGARGFGSTGTGTGTGPVPRRAGASQ